MYRHLEQRLAQRVLECLQRRYPDASLPRVVIEQPPNVALGDFAIPMFPLAKPLRSAPLKIAESIRAEIGAIEGIAGMQVTPPGYLNVRIDRAWLAAALASGHKPPAEVPAGKILVEHSSINPNKAAHIGHLRNAILGDTFVRLLRYAGREVDIQNYIDNTGVQVADVVVGFQQAGVDPALLRKAIENPAYKLPLNVPGNEGMKSPRFDYLCWELYAQVSAWYEDHPEDGRALRNQALHEIETGGTRSAELAELISTAILKLHLKTMFRLDIKYDFLPRENEILRLHFWEAALEKLIDQGVLFKEKDQKRKNWNCWVMRRPGAKAAANQELSDEDQKVIVRSNGTVGYVGKDIAYHMWKFGLLGLDFAYERFFQYPDDQHWCWVSAVRGAPDHPHFGGVSEIYNVIDARQSEAQSTVIEALRGLGHNEAADRYTHLSYEMVALTPRCANQMGYDLTEEEKKRPWIEVSGRKGHGVKADDLIDKLIATEKERIAEGASDLSEADRAKLTSTIAIGALRYFMLRWTRNSIIAFDFEDALGFEGETGPYAQYAVVRANSIFKKAGLDPDIFLKDESPGISAGLASHLAGEEANEFWELWLAASKTAYVVDQCIATREPAYIAKHAFQLAQLFNTFYHRHPILTEPDEKRKQFLLATVAIVRRELIRTLKVMGIGIPPVM